MKKTLLFTGIMLVLAIPLSGSPWRTLPFPACMLCTGKSAYADDVLKKLDSIETSILNLTKKFDTLEKKKLNAIEIAILSLTRKFDTLEKRLAAIEHALTPAKESKVEPKLKDATPVGPEGFVSIGGGFQLGNLSYKASLGNTIFSGEVENQSLISYTTVIFNIKVFNKKETILGGSDFYLQGLYMRTKVPFEVTIFGVNMKSIAGYEINFVRGFKPRMR
ncbi:MAG: hypothetical protein ACUZ77_10155 [Candidatus Brocadiales bacterium]